MLENSLTALLVGLIFAVPMAIFTLLKLTANTLRLKKILKSCIVDMGATVHKFEYKSNYYDLQKYSKLLTAFYHEKEVPLDGLRSDLENTEKRAQEPKNNELALVESEILKRLIAEKEASHGQQNP